MLEIKLEIRLDYDIRLKLNYNNYSGVFKPDPFIYQ